MFRTLLAAIILVGLYSSSSTFRRSQENLGTGSVAWTNPANGRIVDGAMATATLGAGDSTNQLEPWRDLTTPTGATGARTALEYLTGLEVQVTAGTSPGNEKVKLWVRLYEHTVGALSDWKSVTLSGGILDTHILGGDGDFWGITPTWSMITNKNFGIQVYFSKDLTGTATEDVDLDGVVFKWYFNKRYGLASQGAGI